MLSIKLRRLVKNNKTCFNLYCILEDYLFKVTTLISPKLNTSLRFKQATGKWPNYKNPSSFTEKLVTLKLQRYIHDPLVIQCADKYRVREYVKSCGCGHILNDILGVYNTGDDIPWATLPNEFVLKWNFGAGMNLICSDKRTLDFVKVTKVLNRWGKRKYWLSHSEMQYKYTKKCIICEKYLLQSNNKPLTDFKVYCFNGSPLAIFVINDRGNQVKSEFFDTQWNRLENTRKYVSPQKATEKPECLEEMLDCCRMLCKPFPFVRIDFYIINNKLIFGEMTFTPAGGVLTSQTMIDGKEMSEYLYLREVHQ